MITSDVAIQAYVNPACRSIDFWLWTTDGKFCGRRATSDKTGRFSEIQFCEAEIGVGNGPAFRLTPEDAQRLMDSLWECGLRPVAAAGSAGQLAATHAHLDDMRRIAFKQLEMEPIGK